MSWHVKRYGGWTYEETEGLDNAHMMFDDCVADGWSKPAIAAMLGNGAGESGLNPWRWEGDNIIASTDTTAMWDLSHGYGLFQFTPSGKYLTSSYAQSFATFGPNYSDIAGNPLDGYAQMHFFTNLVPNDWLNTYDYYHDDFAAIGIDIAPFYISFDDFKNGNVSMDVLVGAFELRFERPGSSEAAGSYNYRLEHAREWLTIIQDWEGGGGSVTDDDLLGWLLLRHKRRWWRK